ncbi:MAG: hypothetical protein FJX35_21685 [Alphaproteobacteria bacterium]|nr:hypothetical protein [Alphaproteobacteria bacterium]
MPQLLFRAALLGFLALAMIAPAVEATSPLPVFRGVQRIGLLCRLDSLDGTMSAVGAEEICELAQHVWTQSFAGGPKIEVVMLRRNDERVAAQGMLVVALHLVARAGGSDLSSPGGSILALSLGLFRRNPGNDQLFGAAPEAIILSGDEDWRGEMSPALTRLLFAGVAEPLGFQQR